MSTSGWLTIGAPTSAPSAGDDVDDACRHAGFEQDVAEHEGRGRGHLGRLDHRRAAGGERERQLLADDEEREIPRRDDRDDADRLAQHDAEHGVAEIGVAFAVQRAGERRGIAPDVDRAADLAARLGDRLAGFQRVEAGDFVQPRLDQVGGLEQDARRARRPSCAATGRSRRPCARPATARSTSPLAGLRIAATRRSRGRGCVRSSVRPSAASTCLPSISSL